MCVHMRMYVWVHNLTHMHINVCMWASRHLVGLSFAFPHTASRRLFCNNVLRFSAIFLTRRTHTLCAFESVLGRLVLLKQIQNRAGRQEHSAMCKVGCGYGGSGSNPWGEKMSVRLFLCEILGTIKHRPGRCMIQMNVDFPIFFPVGQIPHVHEMFFENSPVSFIFLHQWKDMPITQTPTSVITKRSAVSWVHRSGTLTTNDMQYMLRSGLQMRTGWLACSKSEFQKFGGRKCLNPSFQIPAIPYLRRPNPLVWEQNRFMPCHPCTPPTYMRWETLFCLHLGRAMLSIRMTRLKPRGSAGNRSHQFCTVTLYSSVAIPRLGWRVSFAFRLWNTILWSAFKTPLHFLPWCHLWAFLCTNYDMAFLRYEVLSDAWCQWGGKGLRRS